MTAKPNRKARPKAMDPSLKDRGWERRLNSYGGWIAAGGVAVAITGSALFNRALARRASQNAPTATDDSDSRD